MPNSAIRQQRIAARQQARNPMLSPAATSVDRPMGPGGPQTGVVPAGMTRAGMGSGVGSPIAQGAFVDPARGQMLPQGIGNGPMTSMPAQGGQPPQGMAAPQGLASLLAQLQGQQGGAIGSAVPVQFQGQPLGAVGPAPQGMPGPGMNPYIAAAQGAMGPYNTTSQQDIMGRPGQPAPAAMQQFQGQPLGAVGPAPQGMGMPGPDMSPYIAAAQGAMGPYNTTSQQDIMGRPGQQAGIGQVAPAAMQSALQGFQQRPPVQPPIPQNPNAASQLGDAAGQARPAGGGGGLM